jgi:hypothetical protein|tara:strand:- start:32808 stop:34577 length:1770 start_codon:yes stop_codon:yes gene_type:complete
MNKILIYTILLLAVLNTGGFAQTNVSTSLQKTESYPVPEEAVFVHINSSLFFVGEYVYYKVYVNNLKTENLSKVSKIVYLELINENKEPVLKHKIQLVSGIGQGDFFIPTTIPSGNYKVVSYTTNMLAKASDNYFHQDVSIINPYRGNQNAISKNRSSTSEVDKTPKRVTETSITENQELLRINTDKKNYSKRSPVSLKIEKVGNEKLSGNYSVSVRKIDTISHAPLQYTTNYKSIYNDSNSKIKPSQKQFILPELRGELLTGKIVSKTNNKNFDKQKVALSIPGDNYIFKISNVDAEGNFYFNIDKPYVNNTVLLQVIGDNEAKFDIEVNKQLPISFKNLEFNQFFITPEMENMIVERSVYNQIENGYYRVKPDTIKTIPADTSIYKKRSTVYNLDEYTRFPTIPETMVEIVNDAWITNRNGKNVFFVRNKENSLPTNQPALLLVDGLFVQDHEILVNYNSNKVKSISIVQDKYYFGSQTFQGIVFVETIDGDFYENISRDYIKKIDIQPAQRKKQYFNQIYTDRNDETSQIPDYRRQLLWLPELKVEGETKEFTFYTSDLPGVFEINLQGFTKEGKPVSIKEIFTVE